MRKKLERLCVQTVTVTSPEVISMNVLIIWLVVIEVGMEDHLRARMMINHGVGNQVLSLETYEPHLLLFEKLQFHQPEV